MSGWSLLDDFLFPCTCDAVTESKSKDNAGNLRVCGGGGGGEGGGGIKRESVAPNWIIKDQKLTAYMTLYETLN